MIFTQIMFKRVSLRMFHRKKSKLSKFSKNLYKCHFWLVGRFHKNVFNAALLNTNIVDPVQ